jgi:hypothetical protein
VNPSSDFAFASFWHGRLNPFAYACLKSFPQAGLTLGVFTYDQHLELPPGVGCVDARTICPDESLTCRFIANGKPSLAHFADMFRYRMMRSTGCCWVDTDILCLGKPTIGSHGYVFCHQADAIGTSLINNAVLKLPPRSPALTELIETADAAVDVDQKWGAIGPFLLTPVLAKHHLTAHALDPHVCYPIEPEQFWKLFLTSYRGWAENKVRDASFVHLWSEAVSWSGYDFWACPPTGSYLHDAFERLGALDRFERVATEDEVIQVFEKSISQSEPVKRATASK